MKIAVTYNNGEVFGHFGHTEQFKIYEIENNKIINTEIIDTNGTGHGLLGELLVSKGVNTLICGGLGSGAKNILEENNIKVYLGVEGSADKAIEDFINNDLKYDLNKKCDHHEHDCSSDKGGCTGKISLLTICLIIVITIMCVMGYYIFKLNNDKTNSLINPMNNKEISYIISMEYDPNVDGENLDKITKITDTNAIKGLNKILATAKILESTEAFDHGNLGDPVFRIYYKDGTTSYIFSEDDNTNTGSKLNLIWVGVEEVFGDKVIYQVNDKANNYMQSITQNVK